VKVLDDKVIMWDQALGTEWPVGAAEPYSGSADIAANRNQCKEHGEGEK
jgi:hypothetical protein